MDTAGDHHRRFPPPPLVVVVVGGGGGGAFLHPLDLGAAVCCFWMAKAGIFWKASMNLYGLPGLDGVFDCHQDQFLSIN
jgi:hypothetical protein